mmetsp:Transcript_31742/g.66552  ORF Transcript_31742/g.66552 Transcript_31742/m.66552 type:complete len:87 (+) Transcript_31742:1268-1528(+)
MMLEYAAACNEVDVDDVDPNADDGGIVRTADTDGCRETKQPQQRGDDGGRPADTVVLLLLLLLPVDAMTASRMVRDVAAMALPLML